MLSAVAALGAAHSQSRDAALSQAGTVTAQSMRQRQQLLPLGGRALTSPVPYPHSNDSFPKRLRALAAMLAAGLPIRCVALRAPGAYDTTRTSPTRWRRG
jgi:hypothetical protein